MAHSKPNGRQNLFSRNYGRRSVVKGLGTGLVAGSVLAGGGPLAAAPSKSGHLRFGISAGSTTDSLDPGHAEQSFTQILMMGFNNYLTEIATNGELVGELAESWEASEAADSWVFNLRKGVEFHNGKTVEAQDVISSLNHHRGEESKSAGKTLLSAITDLRADGKKRVIIDLNGGNADFPFMLAQYTFPIQPDQEGSIDWRGAVGAGAYKLKSFEPGVAAVLERHGNYWKYDRAWFDSVEMITIADVTARTNALISGSIDVMDRCDTKSLKLLKANESIGIKNIVGTQHYVYPMRTDTAPFSDNNVRLALKHALDREQFVQLVLNGYGSPGNDHPISPANRFYAADLPQRGFDPDKVKFYLKQAGLSELTVKLSVSDAAFAGSVDGAVLFAANAEKTGAGLKIEVERDPADGYWSNTWMKKGWSASYWGGRPSEDWMLSMAYAKGAAWNETFWNHPNFENLLIAARSELDDAKRRDMYVELQTILHNEGGAVIPCFSNYVFAADKNLQHETIAGNWDMDGFRMLERWWRA